MNTPGAYKIPIKQAVAGFLSFILGYFLLPSGLSAQDTINADYFFRNVLRAETPENIFIENNAKFPIIEKYDFRTETDEMDFDRQEYLFRVSPSTGKKRKAQKDIYNHLISQPDFGEQEAQCALKLEAHFDWLDLFYYHQKLVLINDLEMIRRDRKGILENQIQSLQYKPQDVIENEIESSDLMLEKFELNNELDYLYRKHNFIDPIFSFEDFIAIEQLPDALNVETLENTANRREDAYDLALIEKEIQLEEAESRRLFDFVQLRYRGPHSDLLEERFSVGAAFNITNSGNRKLKIEELKLEGKRLEAEMDKDQSSLSEELANEKILLQKDLLFYEYYSEVAQKESDYLNALADQLLLRADFNPLDILDIKERQIEHDLEKLKLAKDLYEQYLEFIYKSEKICSESSMNFLQSSR